MNNTAVAPQEESNESTDDDYESEDTEENENEQDDSLTALSTPVSAEKQRIQASPTPTPDTSKSPSPTPSGYTFTEVAKHANATSCWSVISGKVYDLTSFISRHPGGEKNILKICGKDGTNAFEGQHGGDSKPEKMLANLYLGALIQ